MQDTRCPRLTETRWYVESREKHWTEELKKQLAELEAHKNSEWGEKVL